MKLHTEAMVSSRIQTFKPGDLRFAEDEKLFQSFVHHHFVSGEGKYFENYGPARYPLDQQVALSIEVSGEEVMAASSVFQNDRHYPAHVARIANRYLKSGAVRRYFGRNARTMTVQMIDQQVDYCREFAPELNWLFISRQAPSGAQFVKHFVENVLSQHSRHQGWKYTEDLYLVCGGEGTATCWHHLIYLDLTGTTTSIPFSNRMGLDEWRAKFA